jgi:hypothetical protein
MDELQTTCQVCNHTERRSVDRMLSAGGERYDLISQRFGIPISTLLHHRENHLRDIVVSGAIDPVTLMADLNAGLDSLRGWLRLTEQQQPGNLRARLAITREMRAHIELMARMTGIMGHANTALSERQERTITAITSALANHPEALRDVRQELARIK